jgi:hypothetical protein
MAAKFIEQLPSRLSGIGVLLSIAPFSPAFEQHFSDYRQIEAAAFLGLSLLVWSAMALVANPLPLKALTLTIPVVTVPCCGTGRYNSELVGYALPPQSRNKS